MQEQTLSLDSSDDTHSGSPESFTTEVLPFVRQSLQSLSAMSDSALQQYICDCAEQFCAAQKRYEQTSSFADAGERDAFWNAEAEALRVRGSRRFAA